MFLRGKQGEALREEPGGRRFVSASATNRKSLDFVDISTISGFFLFGIFIAHVLKIDIKYHRKPQKCKSTCKSKLLML